MDRVPVRWRGITLMLALLTLVACAGEPGADAPAVLALPAVAAVPLDGAPLQVVATTSIIGDVVGRVGGDVIALKTLMGPGQDPHGYEPGARELTEVANADVVFVNGWDLEETLARDLPRIAEDVPIVPISAGVAPLTLDESEGAGAADPHVWLDVANVERWVDNVVVVLSALDPANAAVYEANAAVYRAELAALQTEIEAQVAQIPADRRRLVTNHDALGYFAQAYGFTIVGTIIPGRSTLAEPSAGDLAALTEALAANDLCTLFAETSVSDALARTVAAELADCAAVSVLPLYTGALGPPGSGADSYVGLMRANVAAIVEGLGN